MSFVVGGGFARARGGVEEFIKCGRRGRYGFVFRFGGGPTGGGFPRVCSLGGGHAVPPRFSERVCAPWADDYFGLGESDVGFRAGGSGVWGLVVGGRIFLR